MSAQQVAESAGAAYYFGGKDDLFVETARRPILEAGQAAEIAAQTAKSVPDYRRTL